MLQRTGLRDTLFIAMSNYYYEHKVGYLNALHDAGESGHDLTAFLKFALRGIGSQCRRLFAEIKLQVSKALFRNTMTDLFGRLQTQRKRAISERQVHLLNLLLDVEEITLAELTKRTAHIYTVKEPWKALIRDLNYPIELPTNFPVFGANGALVAAVCDRRCLGNRQLVPSLSAHRRCELQTRQGSGAGGHESSSRI
jgi:hypothetical protein